jgi:hypothetical protein
MLALPTARFPAQNIRLRAPIGTWVRQLIIEQIGGSRGPGRLVARHTQ